MISVILYGRNDAHGYNLHRRAALSLNCIAEILNHPDDEIVFVDYNSPDELPTFIEAVADTLTARCLDLLRVVRVPAAIHAARFAARSDLPAIEPVARNAAARRTNPSNRWLLSTNTDMIFVPLSSRSLSEICGELPDGFYSLPRFELPEWLWERLPRTDPERTLAEVERLGPGLSLDEPTMSYEWMRFDAPGDFQLVLREDFFAIDGFDEEMFLGYHVDSNLSRRLLLHRRSIETLEGSVAGYHCNHNRTPTVYHGDRRTNDPERFLLSLDGPDLLMQRETWGLAHDALEEVPLRERVAINVAESVMTAIAGERGTRWPSDATEVALTLTYDSAHVFPFVADAVVFSPLSATVGYVGVNPMLERMLAMLVEELTFESTLAVAALDDAASVDDVVGRVDILVVDLGVDVSLIDVSDDSALYPEIRRIPARLDLAFLALERLVVLERERLERGEHPRVIVLVNSAAAFWDGFVQAHLNCSYTTPHCRVRRAIVKRQPDEKDPAQTAVVQARRLLRWSARSSESLTLRLGEPVLIRDMADYGGFEEGWAVPDEWGIWTQGRRSLVAISLEGIDGDAVVLELTIGRTCVSRGDRLTVDLLFRGVQLARCDFGDPDTHTVWRIEIPADLATNGDSELILAVHDPRSPNAVGWFDDRRPLGVHLRAISVRPRDRSVNGHRARLVALLRARIGFRRHLKRFGWSP